MMFTRVKSPTTGEEFYVDLSYHVVERLYSNGSHKITVESIMADDSVSEAELVNSVMQQLGGRDFSTRAELEETLDDVFRIPVEGCPLLVDQISNIMGVTA